MSRCWKKIKNFRTRKFFLLTVVFFLVGYGAILLLPQTGLGSPLLANYYLKYEISPDVVDGLSRYDLLILDMETQNRSRAQLERIRRLNPDIVMLAYITSQEIRSDAAAAGLLRAKLAGGISPRWYLTNTAGVRYSFWPGTWMLNVSDQCPKENGAQWNDYLANFVAGEILSTGLWNGVFYDNAWGEAKWFLGENGDLNNDGVAEENPDESWRTGMRELFNLTSQKVGSQFIIVGNANTEAYLNDANGIMLENFQKYDWSKVMQTYYNLTHGGKAPRVIVINANTGNQGLAQAYKQVRYGLGSALMGDGYFSFDYGDQNHGQTWWYDEYDVNLGVATGQAKSLTGAPQFKSDVWRRDYEHGIALVNPTAEDKVVDLGGDYEKIIGKQDTTTNDGAIVSKVKLGARDGLLMLKTFQTISDVPFKNGDFVRFYGRDGSRARNGFFAFENGYSAGVKIYKGDINADGAEEKIVLSGRRLEIFDAYGGRWADYMPFGGDFKGEINIAVGRFSSGATDEILAVPSVGGSAVLYNYHGGIIREIFYPLGTKYKGGFSVAMGDVDGDGASEAVLGTLKGAPARVIIFDKNIKKQEKSFSPFGVKYSGPIKVAVLKTANSKSAIAALLSGPGARVMVLDNLGKKKSEFAISGLFGTGGNFSLCALDVNFDGSDEVLLMGE